MVGDKDYTEDDEELRDEMDKIQLELGDLRKQKKVCNRKVDRRPARWLCRPCRRC